MRSHFFSDLLMLGKATVIMQWPHEKHTFNAVKFVTENLFQLCFSLLTIHFTIELQHSSTLQLCKFLHFWGKAYNVSIKVWLMLIGYHHKTRLMSPAGTDKCQLNENNLSPRTQECQCSASGSVCVSVLSSADKWAISSFSLIQYG